MARNKNYIWLVKTSEYVPVMKQTIHYDDVAFSSLEKAKEYVKKVAKGPLTYDSHGYMFFETNGYYEYHLNRIDFNKVA